MHALHHFSTGSIVIEEAEKKNDSEIRRGDGFIRCQKTLKRFKQ